MDRWRRLGTIATRDLDTFSRQRASTPFHQLGKAEAKFPVLPYAPQKILGDQEKGTQTSGTHKQIWR